MENNNNSKDDLKKIEKEKKKALRKYKDLDGLSDRYLNIGLWLAENRKKMKQILVIFLLVFSASTLSYSIFHYVNYLLYGRAEDREMIKGITEDTIDSKYLRQVMSPNNLLFYYTRSFFVQGRYDFLTKIYNPNERHTATFYYCFEEVNRELACGNSFILPGEEKYILELNKQIDSGVGAINFVIKDINWQRITAHVISGYDAYRAERLNFKIETLDFNVKDNFYHLKFSIHNLSSFNYVEVPLQIILFSNEREIGANRYVVKNIKSKEKLELSILWPAGQEKANRLIIEPEVNILDENIFIPFTGR